MTDSFHTKTGSTDFTRKYDPNFRSQRYKASREKAERDHKRMFAKIENPKPYAPPARFPTELDATLENLDDDAYYRAAKDPIAQSLSLFSGIKQ